jgi:GxxExxY protein
MKMNDLTGTVIGLCIKIHKRLGPGLFENIYEQCLCYELNKLNITYERQKKIKTYYEDLKFDTAYRADVIVDNRLLLELKSVETLHPLHFAQTLNYLRLGNFSLALLINFNVPVLVDGVNRVANKFIEE